MKVFFIFHTPWIKGGASKSGLTLVKGLQNRGIEIIAACPYEGSLTEELRNNEIPVETFGHEWAYPYFEKSIKGFLNFFPKLILNFIRNKKALRKMVEFAKAYHPDIIHTNSSVADIGIRLAKKIALPHVSHYREFGWKDCNAIMWHENRMSRYPLQHGIAISKKIYNFHTKDGDDNIVIYNGIVQSNKIRSCKNKEPWLLYVGGIFEEKGIEDLLQAYSLLDENIRRKHPFRIAGSAVNDDYMSSLFDLTKKLGIVHDIEWLGERDDIDDLMYKALALVVPSHHEAFGRIVAEGMANGTLVIGNNKEGIKEQFDNGVDCTGNEIGLRFNSPEEMASRMLEVISDETSTFQPMIRRGQDTVRKLYSIDGYVDQVVALYYKILRQD